jgi:tetratricopeptide (TPR) repeat protein
MVELAEGLSLGSRFRLKHLLGEGGMGQVWLATDPDRDSDVALKILNAELAAQQGFVDLLTQECLKARQLLHPNIVRVYEIHHEAGLHFISMEYVDGDHLKSMRGRDWRSIVELLLPLTDALAYAHRLGVVHRDVTAANVLLDKAGNPRLLDFGIASFLHADNVEPLRSGGSLPAMSPQQVAGEDPAVSDDVYAFGSLLYDLISGAPLFGGDISRDRVMHELPPPLTAAGNGGEVPEQLQRLVAAMLDKDAQRRPAGLGAVRSALEELLADAPPANTDAAASNAIRPVARQRSDSDTEQAFRPLTSASGKSSIPPKLVYGGVGILALTLVIVVFVLPDIVERNQRAATAAVAIQADAGPQPASANPDSSADAASSAEAAGNRELADNVLADVLELEDRLNELAVDAWGGAEWTEVRELVRQGDEAYKDRLYGDATRIYREALVRMQPFEMRASEVLATALQDGSVALEEGNQLLALERFDLALAIDANNQQALVGRERALQLEKLLTIMRQASAAELESRWQEALAAYEQAVALDPLWTAATEGRERARAAMAGNAYQAAMSAGYAALSAKEYSRARQNFAAALSAKPGDKDAQAALEQLTSEQKLARIISLSKAAEALQAQERWTEAVARYEEILATDSTVLAARNGLELSTRRADLDARMNTAIKSPDRLADDAVWSASNELLEYAQGVSPKGAVLSKQISELDALLQRARVPVQVRLESDNETDVVIYKVGKLGRFQSRDIALKPGVYTVVGVRSGYRDVRQNFRVAPETGPQLIQVRCEDPI